MGARPVTGECWPGAFGGAVTSPGVTGEGARCKAEIEGGGRDEELMRDDSLDGTSCVCSKVGATWNIQRSQTAINDRFPVSLT